MGLEEDFEKYADEVRYLPETTTEDKLLLYGLYKQATVGDFDASNGTRKEQILIEAWKGFQGKSKEEAMREYVTKAKQLMEAAGFA